MKIRGLSIERLILLFDLMSHLAKKYVHAFCETVLQMDRIERCHFNIECESLFLT